MAFRVASAVLILPMMSLERRDVAEDHAGHLFVVRLQRFEHAVGRYDAERTRGSLV